MEGNLTGTINWSPRVEIASLSLAIQPPKCLHRCCVLLVPFPFNPPKAGGGSPWILFKRAWDRELHRENSRWHQDASDAPGGNRCKGSHSGASWPLQKSIRRQDVIVNAMGVRTSSGHHCQCNGHQDVAVNAIGVRTLLLLG
jgi:hypothetical protein